MQVYKVVCWPSGPDRHAPIRADQTAELARCVALAAAEVTCRGRALEEGAGGQTERGEGTVRI